MKYILSLEIGELAQLVEIALEKEKDELLHRQWSAMLPYMSLKMLEYMSFNEYKNKVTGKNIDLRPVAEIIKEIEEAHGRKVNV